MNKVTGNLIVCFQKPFWSGIFQRFENNKLYVAKVVFGAEPKEYEIYEFVLKHYDELQFSPAVDASFKEKKINPKRLQREIRKQTECKGIGTKSQQALSLQREQFKASKKVKSREIKEAEKQRKFDLKQQKKKDKHRGK